MDDYVDAIIRIRVPKWQIGEEVSVHFPDTMMKRGKCEILDEGVVQEVLNKRCMTAVTNEYLIALHSNRPQGEWVKIFDSEYPNVWHYECSECHERPLCSQFTKEDFLSGFCPNCGVRMVENGK